MELQQVVVLNPIVALTDGPTTLAFPGYALLLRFVGRKGAIYYYPSEIVDAIPTGFENTSVISLFTLPSRSRTLQRILSS